MNASRTGTSSRAGFALPATIIALVLLSALVAGALFISTEELRAGRVDVADQRALAAAESGLERAILGWDGERNTRQKPGSEEVVERSGEPPNDSLVVTSMRVQREAIWLTAAATAGGDGLRAPARHRIAASLRLVRPDIPLSGALSASGNVVVSGGLIDGGDLNSPDSSGYCPSPRSIAGVIVGSGTRVDCPACGASPDVGVYGTPPIDSTGDSASVAAPVAIVSSLVEEASITLPGGTLAPQPSVVAGDCNRTDALNWGDPGGMTPCRDRYPIVHVRGSATLAAGARGQGILVVDGSLRLEANAQFTGVVIAGNAIEVVGEGAGIVGVAFAGDGDGAGASVIGSGGTIRYASCAVTRATLGSARLARTPVRWWVELR
jgi:hypothetical protein